MKIRLLTWTLALALLILPAARGEEADQNGVPAVPALPAEEYRPLSEAGLELWIPARLESRALTREDRAKGCIAYFSGEDGTEAVAVTCIGAGKLSLEDLRRLLVRKGLDGVADAAFGDMRWLTYPVPEWDARSYAYPDEAGFILEITFAPMADEAFAALAEAIVASVRPI